MNVIATARIIAARIRLLDPLAFAVPLLPFIMTLPDRAAGWPHLSVGAGNIAGIQSNDHGCRKEMTHSRRGPDGCGHLTDAGWRRDLADWAQPSPAVWRTPLSITDYVIDILLILVIFRQVRPHELTLRAALLPLVLLAAAGAIYLRPSALRGNDLELIVILTVAGAVLGALSGVADRTWRDERGRLLFRAGALSVIAWLLGMGFRFWFAYYAYHSGGPAVARFSVRHDITGAGIWTTALVLMAFGQVLARLAVLQLRRIRAGGYRATPARTPSEISGRYAG
jgi:hypothetical protein